MTLSSSLMGLPGEGLHFGDPVLIVLLSLTVVWSSIDPNSGPDLQPEPRPALRATRLGENLHTPTTKIGFTSEAHVNKTREDVDITWQEKKTHLCWWWLQRKAGGRWSKRRGQIYEVGEEGQKGAETTWWSKRRSTERREKNKIRTKWNQ